MDTQKNLMMFTIVISVIYGIWAIFAPAHIMSTYGTPEEFVNPVALNIVMLFGVAAWVVAILGWHVRSTVAEENIKKTISYFATAYSTGFMESSQKKCKTGPKVLNHIPFQNRPLEE